MSEKINKYIEARDRLHVLFIQYHNRELVWLHRPSGQNRARLKKLAREIRRTMQEMMKLINERTSEWVVEFKQGKHPSRLAYKENENLRLNDMDLPRKDS